MKQRLSEKEIYQILRRKLIYKEKWYTKREGITLIALVITIVLNCSYLAMDQMNKIEKI